VIVAYLKYDFCIYFGILKETVELDSGQLNSGVSICKQKTCYDVKFIFQIPTISTCYAPSTGGIETRMAFGQNLKETCTKKA
jgi:hypothetical protein